MQHKSFDDIRRIADVLPAEQVMGRRERLERWAALLEAQPPRTLQLFSRMEFLYGEQCRELRSANSPIAVALADPLLRQAGLAGDRVGDAMDFFALTADDAHVLLCDCHYQGSMSGARVAADIRAIAGRVSLAERWQRLSAAVKAWWA